MNRNCKVPAEIKAILDASLRRVRRILLFRGACAALAAFVASVLAIMAVDAMVTIYASWIRWALWAAGVVGTCTVAYVSLVKPLGRKYTSAEMASLIERNHPELEERLSTVVELAESGDLDSSSRLMDEITRHAVMDAGSVSPKKEFTGRTVKPRLFAAAAALFILAALFAAFPKATLRLVTRALMPSAEVDNIYASSLKVSPGDQVVLVGTPLTVNLAVDGGFPSRAFVRTRRDGRRETVERMVRVTEEGAAGPVFYSFSYPRVTESFSYRINCGSALTRSYRVEAVPEPTYSERAVEIVHPEYTGRAPERYTNTASIVGIAGSRVTVTAKPTRPGISGEARLPSDRTVPASASDGLLEFSFVLDKDLQGGWSTVVWDDNGFSNQVDTATITVVKDMPPDVSLVVPEKLELKLPRNGSLPIEFAAKDDFGVMRAVLEMCVGAGAWEDEGEIEVSRTGPLAWGGSSEVQFLSLTASERIGNSAVVRYRVRVEDNLPPELGGPGVARTPEIMVQLIAKGAKSLERQALAAQVEDAKKDLKNIADHLRRSKRFFEHAAGNYYHIENNEWHRNEAAKNSNAAKAESRNAEGLLAEFIEGLADSRLETGVEMFRSVLDGHVKPVRLGAEDVFLLGSTEEKRVSCLKLSRDTDAAIKALEDAQRKFAILTKAAEDIQRMEDLAEREETLAEMAERGEIDAGELSSEERKLSEELKGELKDDLAKSLDKQMERAKELEERGKELEMRQDEIAKKAEDAANGKDEESMKAAAEEEAGLAKDIADLANQTKSLAREIEKLSGTPEMDQNKTSEPVEKASDMTNAAADEAKSASDKINSGDADGAKDDMQKVKASLEQAREQLADAQRKMDAKNQEFADGAKGMKELLESVEEAANAARKAAAVQKQGERQAGDEMRNAAQKAAEAASKLKGKTSEQARKLNMPIERFEEGGQDAAESDGSQSDNSKPAKKVNPGDKSDKRRRGLRKRSKRGEFGDDGEDENWFKMKSETAVGAESDALDDVPSEYRSLVRDYFEALNKGGKKK